MSRTACVLGCAALIAACQSGDVPTDPSIATGAAVAPAATVIHTRQRTEIVEDAVVDNPCSGEQVAFHFNELVIAHDLEIVGKAFHIHLTTVDRGTHGVGLTTGAKYNQVGAQISNAHFTANVGEVQTFVLTGAVIGQGKVPNFNAHEIFHLRVSPDGVVKVEFDRFRFTCK